MTLCKSNLTGHDIIFLHRSLFVAFLAALDSYFSPLNFFLCRHNFIFDRKLTNPRQWCCVTPHRTYDKSLRVTTTLMRGCWSGTEFGHYLVSSSMSLWQTNLFITIKRYTQWPNKAQTITELYFLSVLPACFSVKDTSYYAPPISLMLFPVHSKILKTLWTWLVGMHGKIGTMVTNAER